MTPYLTLGLALIALGFLLMVAIWAFARLYYFMFYVIEHYVDPSYKFAGIWSFLQYLARRRKGPPRAHD